jgi:hypothetical protein
MGPVGERHGGDQDAYKNERKGRHYLFPKQRKLTY